MFLVRRVCESKLKFKASRFPPSTKRYFCRAVAAYVPAPEAVANLVT